MQRRLTRPLAASATAVLALLVAGPVPADGLPGEGTTITMARATWHSAWFHAAIYQQALEELGYTFDAPVTLDNPPFYQAVGQGDVHPWVNGWCPLHNTYEPQFAHGA